VTDLKRFFDVTDEGVTPKEKRRTFIWKGIENKGEWGEMRNVPPYIPF
jgi:hypothetical protein